MNAHARTAQVRRHLVAGASGAVNPLVAVTLAVAVSGCGLLMPYDKAMVVEPSATAPAGLELAGGAEDALRDVEERRTAYYRDLFASSFVRGTFGSVAVGLTAWSLYNVIRPTGGGDLPLGDRRRTIRLGAALGGLYGLHTLFVHPSQDAIYAEGYRELTCLMVQSAPLLMTQRITAPRATSDGAAATAAWNASLAPRAPVADGGGDVEQLERDLARLDTRILTLRTLVAFYDARVDGIAGDSELVKRAERDIRAPSRAAIKALDYATNAYNEGHLLISAARDAGYRIRAGAALIVSQNNVAIQKIQADIPDAATTLKTQHAVLSSVRGIGAETEADQKDITTGKTAAMSAVDPTLAFAGYAIDRAPTVRMLRVATPAVVAKDPVAEAAKDAPVCKPADASPGSLCPKPTKPVKPAATGIAASSADLKKIRDQLDATIKSVDAAAAAAKKKAEEKALEQRIAALSVLIKKKFKQENLCEPNGLCLDALLSETESLYADRRPVAQALLNFRARMRQAEATPECADLATLRVVPDGPITARAGTTVQFIVSQRIATEKPLAVLQGGGDGDTGASLMTEARADSKLSTVTLKLGKDMTEQRLRIVLSDSRQTSTQIVSVRVLPAKKAATDAADAAHPDQAAAKS